MGGVIKRKRAPRTSSAVDVVLPHRLPRLAAREVRLLAGHDTAWMNDIEQHEREQHHRGVKNVLVSLVLGDSGLDTVAVFDQAENDTDGDESQDAVEREEQLHGAGLFGFGEIAAHFALEAESEVGEADDEELLKAHTAHVNVEATVNFGGGEIVAGGHGCAGGLDDERAGRFIRFVPVE